MINLCLTFIQFIVRSALAFFITLLITFYFLFQTPLLMDYSDTAVNPSNPSGTESSILNQGITWANRLNTFYFFTTNYLTQELFGISLIKPLAFVKENFLFPVNYSTTSPLTNALSISILGDTMLGNWLNQAPLNPLLDQPSQRVKKIQHFFEQKNPSIIQSEFFINLEGPVYTPRSNRKNCQSSNCYTFAQPPETIDYLLKKGVSIVSGANNHSFDLGAAGLQNQALLFLPTPILYNANQSNFVVKNNLYFLATSHNAFVNDWRILDIASKIKTIKQQNPKAFIFISAHAGCEGAQANLIVNKDELCFGENRGNIVKAANQWVASGANLIAMHGPHVLRAADVNSQHAVFFSLGNGAVAHGILNTNLSGQSLLAHTFWHFNSQTNQWTLDSCLLDSFVHKNNQLVLDPTHQSAEQVKTLSRQAQGVLDFPNSQFSQQFNCQPATI